MLPPPFVRDYVLWHLVRDGDYDACLRLALVCRAYSEAWRYVAPRALVAFVRGGMRVAARQQYAFPRFSPLHMASTYYPAHGPRIALACRNLDPSARVTDITGLTSVVETSLARSVEPRLPAALFAATQLDLDALRAKRDTINMAIVVHALGTTLFGCRRRVYQANHAIPYFVNVDVAHENLARRGLTLRRHDGVLDLVNPQARESDVVLPETRALLGYFDGINVAPPCDLFPGVPHSHHPATLAHIARPELDTALPLLARLFDMAQCLYEPRQHFEVLLDGRGAGLPDDILVQRHHAGHPEQSTTFSVRCGPDEHGATITGTKTPMRLLLARVRQRTHFDDAVVVHWSRRTMELAPLEQCRAATTPATAAMTIRTRLETLLRTDAPITAVSRCRTCKRFLSAAHSKRALLGDTCRRRCAQAFPVSPRKVIRTN